MTRRDAVRTNRWQLAALSVPLARAVLYVIGLAPGSVTEQVLARPVQAGALVVLGIGALVAIVGTLRQRPAVERLGLDLLWPTCIAYAFALLAVDPGHASVWLVVYGVMATCAFSRSREVTKAEQLATRVLQHERSDSGRD